MDFDCLSFRIFLKKTKEVRLIYSFSLEFFQVNLLMLILIASQFKNNWILSKAI